jgi:hypothetical protein
MNLWKAPQDVLDLIREIQLKNHQPRLAQASVTAAFDDSKPFVSNKINLGKLSKFSPFNKLWQNQSRDFCLVIPSDLWVSVLNAQQREAYIDLQLTRCEVEYIPETVEENGKKKPIKDEWGRVQYTDQMKFDDLGNPKWKVIPLDLEVFTKNVRRYGLWLDMLTDLKEAIDRANNTPLVVPEVAVV